MNSLKRINVNPKARKTTDCVVRAISTATGKSYEDVVDGLVNTWKESGYHIGDKKCYGRYLETLGWVKCKQPRRHDGTKYLVGEINELIHVRERAIITMTGHMVACIEGAIIDSWDSRYRTIGNYYIYPEDYDCDHGIQIHGQEITVNKRL